MRRFILVAFFKFEANLLKNKRDINYKPGIIPLRTNNTKVEFQKCERLYKNCAMQAFSTFKRRFDVTALFFIL